MIILAISLQDSNCIKNSRRYLSNLANIKGVDYLSIMNDRLIGYTVIIALILFLVAPVSFLVWKSAIPVQTYTIKFEPINSVAFLTSQDPVYARGVEIGHVISVQNSDENIFATIETRKKTHFYNDYQALVIPKGIMGDRYLEIDPGYSTSGPPLNPKDTLLGSFVLGPAEAISYVDVLRLKIHELAQLIEKLKNGTTENKSLFVDFWEGIESFDSISSSIAVMSKNLEKEIDGKLDSLVEVLEKSSRLAIKTSTLIPSYLKKVENLLIQTSSIVNQINSISEKSLNITRRMNNPELILWSNKLKILKNDLQKVMLSINDLEIEGIKLPIKLNMKTDRKK